MKCVNCGTELEEGSKFCEMCGTPVEGGSAGTAAPGNHTSGQSPVNNTKKIRKWFKGRPVWPVVLTVLCVFMLIFSRDGKLWFLFVTAISAAIWAYTWMGTLDADVQIVDDAWAYWLKFLTKRGMDKLNLIQEQVGLIDPVIVTGRGVSPDSSFMEMRIRSKMRKGLFFSNWFSGLLSLFIKDGTELDPYVAYRIASDELLRSMLRQLTVFMFTDTQVLIYTGNIDISTGMIYSEKTDEVFYQDIEGINFTQEVYKVQRKHRFVNKVAENVVLYLGGCTLGASVSMDAGVSVVDREFSAMRDLIRDKKNG